jgi:hypothetical protein
MVTQLNINESLLQEALALNDQATIDALVEMGSARIHSTP